MSTPELNLKGILEPPSSVPRRKAAALPPVDPRLDEFVQNVIGKASARTGYTYRLGEGSRTPEQQAEKVARGVSWTYDSAHMHGRGRDVLAYDENGNYITRGDHPAYTALGDAYTELSPSAPVRVKWGVVRNGSQVDPGHFELQDDGAASPAPQLNLDGILEPPLNPDGVSGPSAGSLNDLGIPSDAQELEKTPVIENGQIVGYNAGGDAEDEVISTESTVDSRTGEPLSLKDPRRKQKPDSSTIQTTVPPSQPLPALRQRESFDVQTMEGRQALRERNALERKPGTFLDVAVPVPETYFNSDMSMHLVRDAYIQAAKSHGVPDAYFDSPAFAEWEKTHANGGTGYIIHDGQGKQQTLADVVGDSINARDGIYDEKNRTLRIRLRADEVSSIVDDYKLARLKNSGIPGMEDVKSLSEVSPYLLTATDEDTSPGEKFLAVAGPSAAAAAKGASLVGRPLQAISAGVFSAVRGHNPLPTAYKALTTGETPAEGTNPVGNYLRDSAVLNRINPRLGAILGGGADVLLDPANLIGLGLLGKGAKFVAGVGRVGRAAEEVNALGRSLGLLERGFVEARPLGLEAATVEKGGDLAALEDRLSRVLEVTRKLKAGEELTPEERALHAEVVAAAEAAPSAAVRSEQLKYARERYEYHVEQAANATSKGARENAQALADDYAKEVARLEGGEAPATGPDGIDVTGSRFNPSTPDTRPLWQRAASNAKALVQLPKAKAGFDLSATGRQGLAQILAHPTYLKEAFTNQLKAFASEDAFNAFRSEIMGRPDFQQMQDAGLFLSSVGPEAEEAFASKLADKVPGVRGSDRAYSAALDSIRTQAWDNYVSSLPEHLRDNPDTLKAVADLINISTGRGVVPILDRTALGKKIVDLLNVPFFSPRNTASKFNLVSPSRIVKNMMSAETRPVALLQLRDASRGLATLGTTLGLLHFAGLDVGIDPRSSDFGHLRVGKAVYDLTGGESYTARYLMQMAQSALKEAKGEKVQGRFTLEALTRRYLRTQLQPLFASGVDAYYGEDVQGRKVTKAGAALDLVVPFVVDDVIKGYQSEGWLGAAKAAPGVLGVGVNYYDRPKQGRKGGGAPVEPDAVPVQPDANYMRLEGEPESRNVEDRRGVQDSPAYTAEDHRALVDERREQGAPEMDDAEAASTALLLDGMPEKAFADFAKHLDESYQLGAVGEGAGAATEYAARGLGRLGMKGADEGAEGLRVMRALSREKRLRPVQFYFDAAQGRYGKRLRDEAMEGIYYPENHLPSSTSAPPNLEPAPSSSSAPPDDEPRRLIDEASADSEPTFVEFPDWVSKTRIPRSSMPQVKGEHRGAMVNYLRGRGIAHSLEEVPAKSLRPSQLEWSPEKVKRALSYDGPQRRILVSSDNHVADGHHQWLADAYEDPERRIPIIRLDSHILPLLMEMARFPSSGVDEASA